MIHHALIYAGLVGIKRMEHVNTTIPIGFVGIKPLGWVSGQDQAAQRGLGLRGPGGRRSVGRSAVMGSHRICNPVLLAVSLSVFNGFSSGVSGGVSFGVLAGWMMESAGRCWWRDKDQGGRGSRLLPGHVVNNGSQLTKFLAKGVV